MSDQKRFKILVTRPDIPQAAMQLLQEKFELTIWPEQRPAPRDFILGNASGVDGIFCFSKDKIDKKLLAAFDGLKVIGTMSVGHEHIDMDAVKQRGIIVGYTPNVLTNSTADLTVALLLAASRRMFEAREELVNGNWIKMASWGPEYLCGQEPSGSTVGIYGMGRIGQAVMKRLKAFDVARFLYSGRAPKPDVTDATFVEFDTLCKESDFIVVTCALTPETKEIFNERAFQLMKPNCVFVNTSRGGAVDQDALIKALKARKIFAAGLDVVTPEPLPPDHELTKLSNCVVIPHIGSATYKTRSEMAMLTVRNIIAALEGTPMPARLC